MAARGFPRRITRGPLRGEYFETQHAYLNALAREQGRGRRRPGGGRGWRRHGGNADKRVDRFGNLRRPMRSALPILLKLNRLNIPDHGPESFVQLIIDGEWSFPTGAGPRYPRFPGISVPDEDEDEDEDEGEPREGRQWIPLQALDAGDVRQAISLLLADGRDSIQALAEWIDPEVGQYLARVYRVDMVTKR